MKKYFLFSALIIILAFIACTKENDTVSHARAVVEAYLTPGKTLYVHITSEILLSSSDTVSGLDNLILTVSSEGVEYPLQSMSDGYYCSDSTLHILEGYTYSLSFEYNGELVTSSTIIPSKPVNFTESATSIVVEQFDPSSGSMPSFPDPVELNWDNPGHDYYIIVVENIESDPVPTDTANDNRPSFRTEPTQSNTYKIQAMQFKYYGSHNIILYKLNPEYAALYNDNGSNSLNLTSPESNINNGWGIFTGINADTLQIEVTN
jgi:hypothetical protein